MEFKDVINGLIADGKKIGQAAAWGDKKASRIIELYQLVHSCPSDPGARGLLIAAYDDYRKGPMVASPVKVVMSDIHGNYHAL